MSKLTINEVAFSYYEVTLADIDVLLDIARQHGITYWHNANHYDSLGVNKKHVVWFEPEIALNGNDSGHAEGRKIVPYGTFLRLFKEHYGEVIKSVDEMPKRDPQPRYRKRRRQKPTTLKTFVRVLYVDQKTYTFKNVRSVQIIDNKVFIQHERVITDGIKESAEVEIDGDLVMAVVIHEAGNRSNFFRNIDGTWDFQNEDGTVINNGQQLGRIFKK